MEVILSKKRLSLEHCRKENILPMTQVLDKVKTFSRQRLWVDEMKNEEKRIMGMSLNMRKK